jgi:1-acyl-sn-glycerol-3-phosphate acyltransferase
MELLRGLWAFAVLSVVTPLCGIPAAVISLIRRGSDVTMRVGRLWSRSMLWAVGARVTYVGLERASERRPCIFISNHQSNVDIWALIAVLPLETRFVAKQSLFRVPALGWAMAASGFIPIDRTNRSRAIRSLRAAAARIRDGRPVVLFPEGTRSTDGRLQQFKKGPFHLAVQAAVPIVPIAISGSGKVLPPRTIRCRPGPVTVRFLEPIDACCVDAGDHDGLRAVVREAIARSLGEDQEAPARGAAPGPIDAAERS